MTVVLTRLGDASSLTYEVEIAQVPIEVRRIDLRLLLRHSHVLAAAAERAPERFAIAAPSLTAEAVEGLAAWLEADPRGSAGAELLLDLRALWKAAVLEAALGQSVRREALELRQLLSPGRALSGSDEARLVAAEATEFAIADARARSTLAPLFECVRLPCARWRSLLFRRNGSSPAEMARVALELELPRLRLLCVAQMAAHCQPEPAVLVWLGPNLTPHLSSEVRRAAFPTSDGATPGGGRDISNAAALLTRLGLRPELSPAGPAQRVGVHSPLGEPSAGARVLPQRRVPPKTKGKKVPPAPPVSPAGSHAAAERVRAWQAALAIERAGHLANELAALDAKVSPRTEARRAATRARARGLARGAGAGLAAAAARARAEAVARGAARRGAGRRELTRNEWAAGARMADERTRLSRGSMYRQLIGQMMATAPTRT
ncbi:hypothetical protein T492DRAFT_1105457 [Pavlovales sp. CCMP2436]|nr:hypothetical protein T492DRAFT_1105457 [Pavlovales sp. CCMP2436]